MRDTDETHLTIEGLERAFAHLEEPPLFVPGRILRRVIKEDRSIQRPGLTVPHRNCYAVGREQLTRIAAPWELGTERESLPETVVLVPRPDGKLLSVKPAFEVLVTYWRLYFHGACHVAVDAKLAASDRATAMVRSCIDRIGQAEFDEIRAVLDSEGLLLPPKGDDHNTLVEFAALYLELEHFAPILKDCFFPNLAQNKSIGGLLAELCDMSAVLDATRPRGVEHEDRTGLFLKPVVSIQLSVPAGKESPSRFEKLMSRAGRADAVGNVVKAAILKMQASRFASNARQAAHEGACEELAGLAQRLARSLARRQPRTANEQATPVESWTEALIPLLEPSVCGLRSVEGRLLYDLQKFCMADEEELYRISLTDWVFSLGRRPIKRSVPRQREIQMARYLRAAQRRLASIRVPEENRARLQDLLEKAVHGVETALRESFRPVLERVLREVGLVPGNTVERVAAAKLVEELCDAAVERGFITISHLRDAISSNDLKLRDITTGTLVRGDALLRADKVLSVELDGVYRRGEFYLRWLQRFSSLFFSTNWGRFLVRYGVIPFGGSFVILEGLQHIAGPIMGLFGQPHPVLLTLPSLLALGLFLTAMLYGPGFRSLVADLSFGVGRVLNYTFLRLPGALLELEAVRRMKASRPYRLVVRFVFRPLLFSILLAVVLPAFGISLDATLITLAGLFAVMNLLLNSRPGRRIEETLTDWLARNWIFFRHRLLPGLIRGVLDFFKAVLDLLERFLYMVDELLRFRPRESWLSLVVKVILSPVWFVVIFLVRFYVNLLIEPQVNPIKHFPVVTVSHKLMLPVIPTLTTLLATPLSPLGPVISNTIAFTTVTLLPGVFGFLVWEFKENWKLYQGNRAQILKPVNIGHHGETMLRLMRPGFHSGTLPKLYRKLRRAELKALQTGDARRFCKYSQELHHVELAIRQFTERELVATLAESGHFSEDHLSVGRILLASNRILLELNRGQGTSAHIALEEQSGWLVAGISRSGWLEQLAPPGDHVFQQALAGFYMKSGVDLVREEVRSQLNAPYPYDISDEGLIVWPGDDYHVEAVYAFDKMGPELEAVFRDGGQAPIKPPVLNGDNLLFCRQSLPYRQWVEMWDPPQLVGGVKLMPGRPA